MKSRQSVPKQWLVADTRSGTDPGRLLHRMPRGSGVLLIHGDMAKGERARLLSRLRIVARLRGLVIIDELRREAMRVHDMRELRKAGLSRIPLIFISPLFATRSHPGWKPLARLKAAALLRLAKAPAIALGGMSPQRFKRVERLDFQGWAGIDAWIRT